METKITHNSTDPHFEANLTRLLEINEERQSLLNLAKVLKQGIEKNNLSISLKADDTDNGLIACLYNQANAGISITDTTEIANWNNLLTGFINTRVSILETEIKLLMA